MGERTSPSGEELPPAFIAADEALVALELEMTVFNVERDEHAARIARKEIGQLLENIPLEVLEVEELPDEGEAETEAAGDEDEGAPPAGDDIEEPNDDVETDEDALRDASGDSNGSREDEDVLPEFEDLLE